MCVEQNFILGQKQDEFCFSLIYLPTLDGDSGLETSTWWLSDDVISLMTPPPPPVVPEAPVCWVRGWGEGSPCGSQSSPVVSLITPGTVGELSQCSESNIFTTDTGTDRAPVSKDFSVSHCLFSLSLTLLIFSTSMLPSNRVWEYIRARTAMWIFIPFLAAGWNHLAFRIRMSFICAGMSQWAAVETQTRLAQLLSQLFIYRRRS